MKTILELSFNKGLKGGYKKVIVKLGYYETYFIYRTNSLPPEGTSKHRITKETEVIRGASSHTRRIFYSYISDESFEKAIIKIQKMCDKNDKWLKLNSHDRTNSSPYTQITTESMTKRGTTTPFLEQRISILENKVGINESSSGFNKLPKSVRNFLEEFSQDTQRISYKEIQHLEDWVSKEDAHSLLLLVKKLKSRKENPQKDEPLFKKIIEIVKSAGKVKESRTRTNESTTDDNVGYVLSCLSDEGLSDNNQRDFYVMASQREKEQLASYAEKFNNAEDYNDSTGGRFQRQVIAPALSIVRRVVGY